MEMTGAEIVDKDTALEIHIQADENKKTLTIQVSGPIDYIKGKKVKVKVTTYFSRNVCS